MEYKKRKPASTIHGPVLASVTNPRMVADLCFLSKREGFEEYTRQTYKSQTYKNRDYVMTQAMKEAKRKGLYDGNMRTGDITEKGLEYIKHYPHAAEDFAIGVKMEEKGVSAMFDKMVLAKVSLLITSKNEKVIKNRRNGKTLVLASSIAKELSMYICSLENRNREFSKLEWSRLVQNVNRSILRLRKQGFFEKEIGKDIGFFVYLSLTKKGRKFYEEYMKKYPNVRKRYFQTKRKQTDTTLLSNSNTALKQRESLMKSGVKKSLKYTLNKKKIKDFEPQTPFSRISPLKKDLPFEKRIKTSKGMQIFSGSINEQRFKHIDNAQKLALEVGFTDVGIKYDDISTLMRLFKLADPIIKRYNININDMVNWVLRSGVIDAIMGFNFDLKKIFCQSTLNKYCDYLRINNAL